MSAGALWLSGEPLVLASGSATRRAMLAAAGVPVEVETPMVDERALEAACVARGLGADRIAIALAAAKAGAVSRLRPGRIVLGGDQILDRAGERFHKPADAAAARAQLASLGGREHALHSAFALVRDGSVLAEGVATATLTMRPLSDAFIAGYGEQAGAAVLASVGGYQIEGLGAQLFERVEGDHFTILGLPLLPLLAALRDLRLLRT